MKRSIAKLALGAVVLVGTSSAHAFTCVAKKEVRKGTRLEVKESVMKGQADASQSIAISTEIDECYFSLKGFTDMGDYKLFVVEGEPPANGAGVVSAGDFTKDNSLRLSYVKGEMVCKVECRKD